MPFDLQYLFVVFDLYHRWKGDGQELPIIVCPSRGVVEMKTKCPLWQIRNKGQTHLRFDVLGSSTNYLLT